MSVQNVVQSLTDGFTTLNGYIAKEGADPS